MDRSRLCSLQTNVTLLALAGRKYLPEATRLSSDYLSKRSTNGFLLMVEGSQIDWALHANDPKWLRAEMLYFEQAVKEALAFADQNGETLVIVTGDHECGGLAAPILQSSPD